MKRADQLRDEIALREASLADAERERDAGDLSSDAYESIASREHAAIEHLRGVLDELGPEVSTRVVRRRKKRWLVVALVCFALALGGVLWSAVSPRQAGNSITGSISLGHAQQITQLLSEAEADTADGNVTAALYAYQRVLGLDANNVAALTQVGWLDFSAGSSDHNAVTVKIGIGYLQKAISLAPRNPAPRLYYAIVADSIPGNRSVATHQFEVFLRLKPSPAQLAIAKPFLAALHLKAS